jgi:DNA helicase HerA-like ATPase
VTAEGVHGEVARLREVRRGLEDGVPPLATSLDGRTFEFEAPLGLALQTGGYVTLGTPEGPVVGQVLRHELERRDGPEVEAVIPGGAGVRSRVSFSVAAGSGVVLGDAPPFHEAALAPAGAGEVRAALAHEGRPGAGLDVGDALFAPGAPVRLDASGFGRHTFLCGQSGSGKSYALGLILEQLLSRTTLRVVVLDPNSDCARLDRVRDGADPAEAARWAQVAGGIRVRSEGAEGDRRLRLRFFDLDGPTKAAVAGLDPLRDREEYGALLTILDEEAKGRPLSDLRALLASSETPDMARLGHRIRNLGLLDWSIWSGDRADGGLLDELDRDDWRCLVVDLGSVAEPGERALVSTAVLGRLWARRGDRRPVLVVVDEAHNVCPQSPGDPLTALSSSLAVRIAAEGRKYGLHLLVSTQRPQKVHENVLSQCDNLVLMRMNSPADVEHLASLFSYAPPTLLARSAVLRLGEALVAGRIAPHPVFVRIGARVAQEGGADVPAAWAAGPDPAAG